jgi:iron complex transport system substrate-binding protein
MKIVSLLPGATEIVCALGLGDSLVAVTHECDYPAVVRTKPLITRSTISNAMSSAEIDAAVRGQISAGKSLYTVDRDLFRALQPDVVLTQRLCRVCAVDYDDVLAAARTLTPPGPQLVSLEPNTLADVLDTIHTVAEAVDETEKADALCRELRTRIEAVRTVTSQTAYRPRVAFLEWLDPLFGGGHWTLEIIEIAGGTDGLGHKHRASTLVDWTEVVAYAPEVLIVAPCGFPVERAWEEMPSLAARPGFSDLPAVQAGRVFVVNGSDYFSRPGPRLVDGLELLAALLHPGQSPPWTGPDTALRRWP